MSNQGRILVVEDNEAERRALSQLLKSEGFTVFGAESADKALGYVDENIDVVLSDLHMGDVSRHRSASALEEAPHRDAVHPRSPATAA
jgi:CheY-like chemotaxis protein